ncbi:MAG: helix-turn-helix domain-containing protein [Pseudomonadota bacterium]
MESTTHIPPQRVRTPDQIGAALRRRRRALGLTQGQLGERAGLRQATISDLERGAKGVHLKSLCDVMAALGLELIIDQRGNLSVETSIAEVF